MVERTPTNVGFTGHQHLESESEAEVRIELANALEKLGPVRGICSLAEGSDQLFAECVLAARGHLAAIIPSKDYESTFASQPLANFRRLLAQAQQVIKLEFDEPTEEAFWAAGQRVVEESEQLIAVWDGRPAGGLGGTADVVAYAQKLGKNVLVIWPTGARRVEQ